MTAQSVHTLCDALDFSDGHGYRTTPLRQVTLFRAAGHESACPLLYQSGLAFILQGFKLGVAAGQEFSNGGDRFLILSSNLPIRCETLATSAEPVLGIHVAVDRLELQRLVSVLSEDPAWTRQRPERERVIVPARLTDDIRAAVTALIEILHDPIASRALGPAALTNLYFQVLRSEDGHVLESLTRSDSRLARISAVMRYMERNLDAKHGIDDLAAVAKMSRSAFHRAFKDVAGESPLQHLKQMRLNAARNLIVYEGKAASQAAHSVGYESANQFSREFKRFFGLPPSKAADLPYSRLSGVAGVSHPQ